MALISGVCTFRIVLGTRKIGDFEELEHWYMRLM